MMNLLSNVSLKAQKFLMNLQKEEKGSSEMIAVVAMVIVILGVAVIFRQQLTNIISGLGEKVMNFIGL